jgi:hypothetical protein
METVEKGPHIPKGTCIIEVNSLHTIAIWTRNLQDVRERGFYP